MNRIVMRRMLPAALLALAAGIASAEEVTVKIDSLDDGGMGAIQAGFVEGEIAAVWLKAPCDGNIVAVQIFWRSLSGGAPPTLGEAIRIYGEGTFPMPGPVLQNASPALPAVLEGPVMTDNVMNEFRHLDEQGTIPLQVPVVSGQTFVVGFEFFDDVPSVGPSVITDLDGCQNGNNAIYAIPGGWLNACWLGVSGDFVIRAIIDCQEPTGACCTPNGQCVDDVSSGDCQGTGYVFHEGMLCSQVTCPDPVGACCNGTGGCLEAQTQDFCENTLHGVYAGHGSVCADQLCDVGACCMLDGTCNEQIVLACDAAGGTFQGPGTSCTPNPCTQPTGACCVGETCVPGQTLANCNGFGGTWVGAFTDCGPPNPCAPPVCLGDSNCDGVISWRDIDFFVAAQNDNQAAWEAMFSPGTPSCPFAGNDANEDGSVNWRDIDPFVALMNTSCP